MPVEEYLGTQRSSKHRGLYNGVLTTALPAAQLLVGALAGFAVALLGDGPPPASTTSASPAGALAASPAVGRDPVGDDPAVGRLFLWTGLGVAVLLGLSSCTVASSLLDPLDLPRTHAQRAQLAKAREEVEGGGAGS